MSLLYIENKILLTSVHIAIFFLISEMKGIASL